MTSVLPDSSPRLQAACRVGFGGGAVGGVVLDAADQPGQPARQRQQLLVLGEGELPVQHGGDPPEPGPAFEQQLLGRQVGVLAAQPVHGDAQAIQGGGDH